MSGARLDLEEALRVIGQQLDTQAVTEACLTIAAEGILVETPLAARQHFPSSFLANRTASLREQRQETPAPRPELDMTVLAHWAVLLRLVGVLLDDRVPTGQLGVVIGTPLTPTWCRIDWIVNGQTRSLREDVLLLLLRRRAQYPAVAPEPPPPEPEAPPWWRRRWP